MARFDEKRSLSEQKGGKSVENGEKRLLLEQKGEINKRKSNFIESACGRSCEMCMKSEVVTTEFGDCARLGEMGKPLLPTQLTGPV